MSDDNEIANCEPQTSEGNNSHRSKGKLLVVVVVLLSVVVVGCIWLYNEVALQKPLDRVLIADSRNQAVVAKAHFDGWISFDTLVFDISDLSHNAAPLDVFRTLLQYAEAMKEHRFRKVILAARGKKKFELEGDYFQQLGQEYKEQNPLYTIRTFPIHLTAMDGSRPFGEYTGGVFAVFAKEMEQFTEFHKKWYIEDFAQGGK